MGVNKYKNFNFFSVWLKSICKPVINKKGLGKDSQTLIVMVTSLDVDYPCD